MTERDDNFLSRWSRRKVSVKRGEVPPTERALEPVTPPPSVRAEPVEAQPAPDAGPSFDRALLSDVEGLRTIGDASSERAGVQAPPPPLPTLEDVAQLTRESSFARFVAPNVDPSVKNAAMKKLFADPHFNVMDGLDTYIDDYNKFEPIPRSMLRQMVNARALGLLDDELEEQPTVDNAPAHHDENADLQLQPDDAAGQRSAAQSAAEPVEPGSFGDSPDDSTDAANDPHDPVPPRGA
jgi:hypothetical protein